MAQPTNTLDSYDVRGIREDLQDIIYDISPEETPFYTKSAKAKATNTLHEWQTDALRSSADNAHIEGGDTAPEARSVTTRLGNYTDRKSTRLNSSHLGISYAVFCLKKKTQYRQHQTRLDHVHKR